MQPFLWLHWGVERYFWALLIVMLNLLPELSITEQLIFAALVVCWLIQLVYWLYFLVRPGRPQLPVPDPSPWPPVSIVICARNEEHNLMEHLHLVIDQDYPNFEVVVVNDSSWDDTGTILKAFKLQYDSRLHLVNLDEAKQSMGGKKFALTLGIKAAKHELILLTDADCRPRSRHWIREMVRVKQEGKEIVLGFSPYRKTRGLLNKLIRFDAFMIALHYFGFASRGKAYMGVGRNLMYTKELFFRIGGFRTHYTLASGDDDLFVQEAARGHNVAWSLHPDAFTESPAKPTWGTWFTQKMRHFTTAPRYKRVFRWLLALGPLSYLLMLGLAVSCFIMHTLVLVVVGLLFVRWVVQWTILHRASRQLQQPDLCWPAPVLELLLTFVQLWLYIMNLIVKPQKWN